MSDTCTATTKQGKPCRAAPTSTGRCFMHAGGAARDAAVSKGGKVKALLRKAQAAEEVELEDGSPWFLSTADDVESCLAEVAQELRAGRLESRRGNVILGTLRVLLARLERMERGSR